MNILNNFKFRIVCLSIIFILTLPLLLIIFYGHMDKIDQSDIAVVLGNKVYKNGDLSPRLKSRLDKCIELYNINLFNTIIVSGATGKEGVDEAIAMKKYLVDNNIPAKKIIVDSNGKNTYKTAEFTINYMKEKNLSSVLIISQYFHLFRTKMIFKKMGAQDVYRAHSDYHELRDVYSLIRETVAILKYALVY